MIESLKEMGFPVYEKENESIADAFALQLSVLGMQRG